MSLKQQVLGDLHSWRDQQELLFAGMEITYNCRFSLKIEYIAMFIAFGTRSIQMQQVQWWEKCLKPKFEIKCNFFLSHIKRFYLCNLSHKTFYKWNKFCCFISLNVCYHDRHFQPSLIFVSEVGTNTSLSPYRNTLWGRVGL
jgi:hypothetical protein